jgi:ribose transport system ATP-binding protein
MMAAPGKDDCLAIEVNGIRKSFGRVEVVKGVSFKVRKGEIHALLGANGAGKSTIIGCLSGAHLPDAGTISAGDKQFTGFTPASSFDAGIAIIHQHSSLVDPLSVADNVFLGDELRRFGCIDRQKQNALATEVMSELGVNINPTAGVVTLSIGQKKMVEIAKAIRRKPKVLVLDEPTASLSADDSNHLLDRIRHLSTLGVAVIYVTHILKELHSFVDCVTVMRDGRVVFDADIRDIDIHQIVDAIAPGMSSEKYISRATPGGGQEILKLVNFEARGVGPIDLELRGGEIVGIFGMTGAGRTELLEALYGAHGPTRGSVFLHGKPYVPASPSDSIARGISLVASDRLIQSLFGSLSALDNLLMPHFQGMSRNGIRNATDELTEFKRVAGEVRLNPNDSSLAAKLFSGGNAQKIAIGRWLTTKSNVQVLLLDEPTQGIDIGARADLYAMLRKSVSDGRTAVLFATSEPAEIAQLADRYVVLHKGQIFGSGSSSRDEARLVALAQGLSAKRAEPGRDTRSMEVGA